MHGVTEPAGAAEERIPPSPAPAASGVRSRRTRPLPSRRTNQHPPRTGSTLAPAHVLRNAPVAQVPQPQSIYSTIGWTILPSYLMHPLEKSINKLQKQETGTMRSTRFDDLHTFSTPASNTCWTHAYRPRAQPQQAALRVSAAPSECVRRDRHRRESHASHC